MKKTVHDIQVASNYAISYHKPQSQELQQQNQREFSISADDNGVDDISTKSPLNRVTKIQKFIGDVFEITSIHGVAYLTKEGTHAIER